VAVTDYDVVVPTAGQVALQAGKDVVTIHVHVVRGIEDPVVGRRKPIACTAPKASRPENGCTDSDLVLSPNVIRSTRRVIGLP